MGIKTKNRVENGIIVLFAPVAFTCLSQNFAKKNQNIKMKFIIAFAAVIALALAAPADNPAEAQVKSQSNTQNPDSGYSWA